MRGIVSVISFCTNDFRFIHACIEGARAFSDQVIVVTCDHFFDGAPENYALLEYVYWTHPQCLFIEYAFDPQSYRQFTPYYPEHPHWRHERANTNRWIAYHFLPPSCETVLFLDSDEIIDGQRFADWLEGQDLSSAVAWSFAAYWYFREATYRATCCDDISLLVKKEALTADHIWHSDERAGILIELKGKKHYGVRGLVPFVHHYSWVRTKEELLCKFATWSHHWERDWAQLVEREFAHPFQGIDFIRGYTYESHAPFFDPLQVRLPVIAPLSYEQHVKQMRQFPHVITVNRVEMRKRELCSLIHMPI
jgi:hypothetical protein